MDAPKIGIGCCCCLTIVGIILTLVSIKTVEPIEYGIKYNSISKTVDDQVFTGGWYMIGPQYSFITFPSTLQNIDFTTFPNAQHGPINVKDSGGQDIQLSISVQYRLQKEKIHDLYTEYQKDYEVRMINYIDSEVRDTVKAFAKDQFWANDGRKAAGEMLRKDINKRLLEKTYATCESLQIIHVGLTQAQEDGLLKTQLATQQKKTSEKQYQADQVRSDIAVNKEQAVKNITVIEGEANATSTNILAIATQTRTKNELTALQDAYKALIDETQITGDQLTQFIYYNDLQDADLDVLYATNNAFIKLRD